MDFARLTKAVSLLDSEEPGDELLRTFLTCASKDAGADMSALYLLQEDRQSLLATLTIDMPSAKALRAVRLGEGVCGRAASTNLPVIIADTAREGDGLAGELRNAMEVRALYATPVQAHDGRPLGVIAQLYRAPHQPSGEELTLSGLYSRLVATVIERVQLHEQSYVRDALAAQRSLELVASADALLGSSLDYEATLDNVARAALPSFADLCLVDLQTEEGGWVRAAAAHADAGAERSLRESPPEAADGTREARLLSEAEGARRFSDELRRELDVRSLLVAPLRTGARVIGALTFGALRQLTDADLHTAEAYARRAALAIENARSYRQAQRAISARNELLAIVAHDLRNLIATVQMGATMLVRLDPKGEGRKQVGIIQGTADRMRRLVNDLLDGASIEAGRFTVTRAGASVHSLLDAVVEVAQPSAEERGLRLVCEPPPDEIKLACDELRILQVLRNLLENAMKFTPRGAVTLRARREAAGVRFEIADEGIGIAPEKLPHIFDRFWTGDDRQGTGLGLYIARTIIEAHQGELQVESEPGRGSTFWFVLPLA